MKQFVVLFPALVVLAAGCSFAVVAPDPEYDSETARETLSSALDAWRDGNARLLIRLSPPIRFVDDDFTAGYQLLEYEFAQPGQAVRPFQSVPVTLTLRKGKGAEITRAAQYQISLEPSRAVLRSDP